MHIHTDKTISRSTKYIYKLFLLIISVTIVSVFPVATAQDVYYEIFVRSFQDSDGDGIGDFNGITQRLDYLEELGITGIWLMPIHPSPSYHGYDITDYYGIHPDYGTIKDFEAFLAAAKERNIKVIIDLVVNHSSDAHPWFVRSKLNQEPFRDYYLWRDDNPGWRGVSGSPAWHQTETGYYLGLFWSGMPDLNQENPAVIAETKKILKHWLDIGVDGFRVDAIQHVIESDDGIIRNTAKNFAWLADMQSYIKSVDADAFFVGETWTDGLTIANYHTEGKLDVSFNYPLYNEVLAALQKRSAKDLAFMLKQDQKVYPEGAQQATFISNHDQVRPATSLSPLRIDVPRIKLAASLLFTLPGIPYIYYGEELGMPNAKADNDEAKRTPMMWDDSEYFGFSTQAAWQAFSSDDGALSVSVQEDDEASVLNHYKKSIALRQHNVALHSGDSLVIDTEHRGLLALERSSDEQNLLILANVTNRPLTVDLASLELSSPQDEAIELMELTTNSLIELVDSNLELPKLTVFVIDLGQE